MTGDSLVKLRIRVVPGPGLVAVLGEVLLVVPSADAAQEPGLRALLAAAGSASLERAVARVVADFDEDQVPPFCLVAPGEEVGLFALVHGEMELAAEGTEGGARLRGREARTWVDRALPGGLQRLVVTTPGSCDPEPDPYVDLRSGVVRGSGVLITPRDEPSAPDPAPAPRTDVATPAQGDTPVSDTPILTDDAPDARDVAEPTAAGPPSDAEGVLRPGGFRPEAIRFGQGGRMETVTGRPLNGHDGHGRRTAAPASTTDPGREPEPTVIDLAAAEIAAASAVQAPAPDSAAAATSDRAPVEASGSDPALVAATSDRAPVEAATSGPDDSAEDGAASEPPGPDPVEAVAAPEDDDVIDLRPTDVLEPVVASTPEALIQAPDRAEDVPFYARTQIVPAPLPPRTSGAVPPPPAGFDPFGMPSPVAPVAAAPLAPPSAPPARIEDLLAEPAGSSPGHGRLVIENGPDVIVDRDCVIGRNPEVDPDVAEGRARAVTLPDAEQRISRVHARLLMTDGGVDIVDAGSVNGTWIEPPGAVGWIAMVPRVPAPLPLGSRIQVGDIVLAYEPAIPA